MEEKKPVENKKPEIKQEKNPKKPQVELKVYDALIDYIKKEKLVGTSPNKIKEKLLKKGWQKELIDFHLKKVFVPERREKYPYHELIIPRREEVSGVYKAGRYKLLTTEKKLIVTKKFPKSLKEIPFKEIELIDYHTTIKWRSLILSIFFGLLVLICALNIESLSQVLSSLFSGDLDLIKFQLGVILFVVLGFFTLRYFFSFIFSLFGKLRILPEDEGPVEIFCSLTDDVKAVIKAVGEAQDRGNSEVDYGYEE